MKRVNRILVLILVACIATVLLTACPLYNRMPELNSSSESSGSIPTASGNQRESETPADKVTDKPTETDSIAHTPAVPIILEPVASGERVEKNEKAMVDYSNASDGYIMVKWLSQTDRQLRVRVTGPSDVLYQYTIHPDGTFYVLPLSDGNGRYEVQIFEQNDSGKYGLALSLEFNVTLVDEFAPFLRPNQFVNFNENSKAVQKAAGLVTGKSGLNEMITVIYEFVTGNLSYDMDFAESVMGGGEKGYIPDLDAVLDRGKGICFDYAAVMTAMLRSQGIPTKMVFGYADDIYHAWISVFSEETGWIDQVIFFDGESWTMMDPTFAAAGNSNALQAFIGSGGVYTETALY